MITRLYRSGYDSTMHEQLEEDNSYDILSNQEQQLCRALLRIHYLGVFELVLTAGEVLIAVLISTKEA